MSLAENRLLQLYLRISRFGSAIFIASVVLVVLIHKKFPQYTKQTFLAAIGLYVFLSALTVAVGFLTGSIISLNRNSTIITRIERPKEFAFTIVTRIILVSAVVAAGYHSGWVAIKL